MDITVDTSTGRGRSTLVLHGDFDVRSTWQVRTAIYDVLEGRDEDVVVDLTEVGAVDVTALRVLAYATREAAKCGRRVTLRGCGPAVRRMLHLTHLRRAVELEVGAELDAVAVTA